MLAKHYGLLLGVRGGLGKLETSQVLLLGPTLSLTRTKGFDNSREALGGGCMHI